MSLALMYAPATSLGESFSWEFLEANLKKCIRRKGKRAYVRVWGHFEQCWAMSKRKRLLSMNSRVPFSSCSPSCSPSQQQRKGGAYGAISDCNSITHLSSSTMPERPQEGFGRLLDNPGRALDSPGRCGLSEGTQTGCQSYHMEDKY